MFSSRLLWRLYAGYVAIILLSTLIVDFMVSRQVTDTTMREMERSLAVQCELLAELAREPLEQWHGTGDRYHQLSEEFAPFEEKVVALGDRSGLRLTVIAGDGTVIADSEESPLVMDNHGSRPEILDAARSGTGNRVRYSNTLEQAMIYEALRVERGNEAIGFVRVSLPYAQIDEKLAELRLLVLLGAGLAGLAALVLGFYFAKRFADPISRMIEVAEAISRGDYTQQVVVDQQDEVGKLAEALNRTANNSARRVAEITTDRNRLSKIFTGMVEGVIGVDQDQRIIHVNQAAADLLDISMADCIDKPIWEHVQVEEIRTALFQALETQDVVKSQMKRSTRSEDLVVDIAAATLRDDDGTPAGAVIVLHDVSELAHLERVRRDFVANASHELKTPITAIQGMTETILDDRKMDGETRKTFLSRIHSQSLRLSTLVADLMTISRLESDEYDAEHHRINLVEIIRRSVAAIGPACTEKGLTLLPDLPDRPVTIDGDVQGISQLIDNLLDNARIYTPEGGTVTVSVTTDAHNAVIAVTDTGIGISPLYHQRIFERFYRVDKARSRGLGGTGLGLSIVKNIAEAHGGTVGVQSVLGEGSTFTVTLPRPA